MDNFYFILIGFVIVSIITLSTLWLGICIGSKYITRVEDSNFLNPLKHKTYPKVSEFTDDKES